MKKILSLLTTLFLLNGCAESLALLGPASSPLISGGNVGQSLVSSAASYGIKHQTGMTPTQHAFAYVKEHNPEMKKEKCLSFVKTINSETCTALRKNIADTKLKIAKKSKIKYLD